MHDHLKLFREYAGLERKRCTEGVTPLEYQRWLDLDRRLKAKFRDDRRPAPRRTVMRVEYSSGDALRDSYIANLSRGGVFVATPFAAEIGTELVLRIHLESTREVYEAAGVVVTNNVDGDFSTRNLGMGIQFDSTRLDSTGDPVASRARLALDELLESASRG